MIFFFLIDIKKIKISIFFMNKKRYKLIIFDADDTLRFCTVPGQPCPNRPGEWKLHNNVKEKLADINWGSPQEGKTAYGIASNQGGVGVGYYSAEMAFQLLKDTFTAAFGFEPIDEVIQMCIPKPEENPACRKPNPGMLNKIMKYWQIEPLETLFVGDRKSDQETAENAGCDFTWAKDYFIFSNEQNEQKIE
ncbi:MAG: HAD-IIIA family hydrolase [Candidatus Cloacimonetes bacterium]|nr:HAD-IIIA family hydrolase [Candidatus Cloacimonadota bacterium]